MLNENLKTIRKNKGLSQEELAIKLNVVRQTVSKWEKGLSVPDAEMLLEIAEVLETPVNVLLGENIEQEQEDRIKELSEKLELLNEQFARRTERTRKLWRCLSIAGLILSLLIVLFIWIVGNQIGQSFLVPNSIGVIGGADGPTSIYLSSTGPNPLLIIFFLCVAVLSLIGLWQTKRRS